MKKLSIPTMLFLFSASATPIVIDYVKNVGIFGILNRFFHHGQLMYRVSLGLERKQGIAG